MSRWAWTSWRVALLGAALLGTGAVARAGVGDRFALDAASDFAKGELEGAAVRSDGALVVGADLQRIALPEGSAAWCAVRGPGGVLYVGAEGGRIYRLRSGRLEPFAETGQMLVASLALGPGGRLYAGTLPEGRIYVVEGKDKVRQLARLEGVEAVWGLHWDGRGRRLIAATGPEGKLLAVDPRGRSEVLLDAEARHLLSMAADRDGTLYVGGSDGAMLWRVRGARVEVAFDFPGDEVTALAVREGRLLAAVSEFQGEGPPAAAAAAASHRPVPGPQRSRAAQRPRPGKGALWRLLPDGRAEKLFASDEAHPSAVAFGPGGYYVALAKDGRVVRVAEDRTVATWAKLADRLVRAMRLSEQGGWLLSADDAAVHLVRAPRAGRAVWRSEPLDAGSVARWGRIDWRARGRVRLSTRSGPTEEPDASWSDWSAPLGAPGLVRSPAARFLQVRVELLEPQRAPVLHALHVHYRPLNRGPSVRAVRAERKKNGDEERGASAPSAVLRLRWTAEDPDGDRLRFRLAYRREGWRRWRPMFPETQVLHEAKYAWDTSGLPDGYYEVRVEASDERDNAPAETRRAVAFSEPLLVDNHAPRFVSVGVQGGALRGRVRDAMGPIARLEVALDGGPWRAILPEDGLLDAAEERFAVPLGDLSLPAGPHVLAVRATDAAGHAVVAEVEVGAP